MKQKDELLTYLAKSVVEKKSIPSIPQLSQELGISTASVREQLEVARRLGIVDVKPKVGIQAKALSLTEPLLTALNYGIAVDSSIFDQFADLRKHLELSYWYESVSLLVRSDIDKLQMLVDQAWNRIQGHPMQNPEREHREFHLSFFKRLENPVVISLLEAYWTLYHKVGVTQLMNREYLISVWNYHQQMVDALRDREFEKGYNALLTHMDLVKQVRKAVLKQRFE
ncbi:MAG: FadR family transcriptional regulator [Chloroflexi bacterium]|nr:FadR family transcriptional regulator [Chloroflexota bacterium]